MPDVKLAEKLNLIKVKLEKYSQNKDVIKLKGYLNELNNIENINLELLKETQIVDCLKKLKKKEDPDYSPKADKIIKKWKTIITQTAEKDQPEPSNDKPMRAKEEKKEYNNEKKRPMPEISDLNNKKFKPNDSNPFEIFSKTSETKSSQESSSSIKLPTIPVPVPTTSLEDILSVDSIRSVNSSISKKNYQLIAQNYENSRQEENKCFSTMDDDEALAKILKSKQSKRILYTGRKVNPNGAPLQPSKLFELATRSLTENLDDFHLRISSYNSRNQFPVAYDLVKPILEKATAKQLHNIEYYSPHLQEDTEELWNKLCEQEFKQVKPLDEDETWRELYYRLLDEREEKFRRARDLISRKQAEKPKERQTKEATVKFLSASARNSSHVHTASSASSKLKALNSSSGPVRQIVHDSSTKRVGSASLGPKRPAIPSAPAMSRGMKATMKLIKKNTGRR
ncbi:unnamed protein product [Brachionus calyciflorus]|uniref:TFIIS N-terminal domain-containing protein n=1 Tax=Brachionus calyciflorus TaxID=104777 RepID=A0A813TLD5_9BILA|nr:unnamed protein product [Brachionus calyciflorus]